MKIINKLIIITFFFLGYCLCNASKIDSLQAKVNSALNDSLQHHYELKLASEYIYTGNNRAAKAIINQVLSYYSNVTDNLNLPYAYLLYAKIYQNENESDKALINFQKSYLKAKNLTNYNLTANILYELMYFWVDQNNYAKAIDRGTELITFLEAHPQIDFLSQIYTSVGSLHIFMQEYINGLKLYRKALNHPELTPKDHAFIIFSVGSIFSHIGNYNHAEEHFIKANIELKLLEHSPELFPQYYIELATAHYFQEEYEIALENLTKVQNQIIDSDNEILKNIVNQNLALIHHELGNEEIASKLLKASVAFQEIINDTLGVAYSNYYSGYMLLNKDNKKAEHYFRKALTLPIVDSDDFLKNAIYDGLYEINLSKKQFKTAYHYQTLIDSLNRNENQSELSNYLYEIEAEYKLKNRIQNLDKEARMTSKMKYDYLTKQHIIEDFVKFLIIVLITAVVAIIIYILNKNHYFRLEKHAKSKLEKNNAILANQNKTIEEQKIELQKMLNELDISHKHQLELEKENSELAMAITANHEINQPLTVIQANLEILMMKLDDGTIPHIKQYSNLINKDIDAIVEILTQYRKLENKNNETNDFEISDEDWLL
jgi:tetratricopeptide (TPR) repeat protein